MPNALFVAGPSVPEKSFEAMKYSRPVLDDALRPEPISVLFAYQSGYPSVAFSESVFEPRQLVAKPVGVVGFSVWYGTDNSLLSANWSPLRLVDNINW